MKVCTCRNCGHVFTATKIYPFCSGACRRAYTLINPKPTVNLEGTANVHRTQNKAV